jgi:hypothetical protein
VGAGVGGWAGRFGEGIADGGAFGPLLSASAIMAAQFWSLASPGSTKAMMAATGVTSAPRAAATVPCLTVPATLTPNEGSARWPRISIGVRNLVKRIFFGSPLISRCSSSGPRLILPEPLINTS